MSRLGLSHRNRTALEIARDRALTKAVDLADGYDRLDKKKRDSRRGSRLARRLAKWQDRAGIATDGEQAEAYRARLAQRRFSTALTIDEAESPWHRASVVEEAETLREEVAGLREGLTAAQEKADALRTQLDEERAAQVRHMEELAARVEAQLLAQIGTAVPGPCTDLYADDGEDSADFVELNTGGEALETRRAAAAQETARLRAEARLPHPADEDQHQDHDADQLRPLGSYPTKKAAIQALYRARVRPGDPRNVNQITDALLQEMRDAGREYDRGPAHKAISELHTPPEHARAKPEQRALATV
jgi:hypothetical protein